MGGVRALHGVTSWAGDWGGGAGAEDRGRGEPEQEERPAMVPQTRIGGRGLGGHVQGCWNGCGRHSPSARAPAP